MGYDRPFLTYEEQIKRVQEKYRLKISDASFARKVFSTISYHSLINGYKDIFEKNGKLEYNFDIVYLYALYKFDRGFQTILFKYSLHVENYFKTKLAYSVAQHISVDENNYLSKKHYVFKVMHSKKTVQGVLDNLSEVHLRQYPDEPTKHYKENRNHIPPWILFKNATFNDVIDLFYFLKADVRNEISQDYCCFPVKMNLDEQHILLRKALTIVRIFRNKIAHDLKFATYKVTKQQYELTIHHLLQCPYVSHLIKSNEFKKTRKNNKGGMGSNDILAMIASIFILLNDKYTQAEFVDELIQFLKRNLEMQHNEQTWKFYTQLTGLPDNLLERLESMLKNMNNNDQK